MISFKFNLSHARAVRAWHKWFYPRPDASDAAGLAVYFHCAHRGKVPGFRRDPKYTPLISLKKSEDDIFAAFGKNTKHKIKRALTEGMIFSVESSMEVLEKAYNEFARAKDIGPMDKKTLKAYWPKMITTKLTHEGEVLVVHGFVHDADLKRVNLQWGASRFRSTDDPQQQNLIGRANRLLHYLDMLYMRERGIEVFDLGGYALNTTNPELIQVNEFKAGFGGQIVEESTYSSLPLMLLRRTKAMISGLRKEL